MQRNRSDLTAYVGQIRGRDDELDAEIAAALARDEKPPWLDEAKTALEGLDWHAGPNTAAELAPAIGDLATETIVLRMGRPVINIVGGKAQLDLHDADSETWRRRLEQSADKLTPAIGSIGRVEVTNHPSGLDYMGTGWVIDDGVIVTNRHVALSFAERGAQGFQFLVGFDRKHPIGVDVDFLEEVGNKKQDPLDIVEVLYIAKDTEADVAFLRLDPTTGSRNPKPLTLAHELIPANSQVAIIGYPARDPRIPDALLMDRIFGKVYDKKRLAPGLTTGYERADLRHDCTTLGGNSGSPLVDLATGEVCGLHFSGRFLEGNYAVPAPVLSTMIAAVRSSSVRVQTPPEDVSNVQVSGPASQTGPSGTTELRVMVPVEITVRVGDPATPISATYGGNGRGGSGAANGSSGNGNGIGAATTAIQTAEPDIKAAVAEAQRLFGQRLDVYAITEGWKFTDGWITDERAVVIAVKTKQSLDALATAGVQPFPDRILGVPIDVRVASIFELVPGLDLEARTSHWQSTYERLRNESVLLAEVNEEMTVTLHTSPDAGWPVLKEFLDGTAKSLVVGMYDLTAPHIVDAVTAATRPKSRTLELVLQRGEDLGRGSKKDDVPEQETIDAWTQKLGERFHQAWAAIRGTASPFKSAYHIKVAVRDKDSFWLSSGNWQSSNQPDADPIDGPDTSPSLLSSHNREWHVIVENHTLAHTFAAYLDHDLKQAQAAAGDEGVAATDPLIWVPEGYFQPSVAELEARVTYTPPQTITKKLRVQPLLTPDNYSDHVLALIESAQQRVFFQNQSLSILEENPDHYEQLLKALLGKQHAGLDVRIIIRNIGDIRDTVSRIRDYGFDTDQQLRLQTNCHTKGIVVDSQTVMLGSQNWTGDGTGPNRDASLIFFDAEVAAYYEKLFLYDWNRVGAPKIDESIASPELADPHDLTPRPGMLLVPLEQFLEE